MLWSDVWLLLAAGAYGPTPLARVLAQADAIEHAVMTRDELNGAIGRLGRAGLLTAAADGMLELTAAGQGVLAEAAADHGTWSAQAGALGQRLGATPWTATYQPAAARAGEPELITEMVYDAALRSYLGRP